MIDVPKPVHPNVAPRKYARRRLAVLGAGLTSALIGPGVVNAINGDPIPPVPTRDQPHVEYVAKPGEYPIEISNKFEGVPRLTDEIDAQADSNNNIQAGQMLLLPPEAHLKKPESDQAK